MVLRFAAPSAWVALAMVDFASGASAFAPNADGENAKTQAESPRKRVRASVLFLVMICLVNWSEPASRHGIGAVPVYSNWKASPRGLARVIISRPGAQSKAYDSDSTESGLGASLLPRARS